MELEGEMLLAELRARHGAQLDARAIQPDLPRLFRSTPARARFALNADRAVGRYLLYPARALAERSRFDLFHVVDHTYAHLVNLLPARRTGVYCHDLDAFRCLLEPHREPRSFAFRGLARLVLRGLQRAAVVFHSTDQVRGEIERHGLIDPDLLVHAPYGVASEYSPEPSSQDGSDIVLRQLRGRPFLLHVGGSSRRKRLDVLFEVFARVRARRPELWLVQQGAALTPSQRAQVERLGIRDALLQPDRLDRATLAGLYRRAEAVLLPSEAEGFGMPLVEALACGARVFASDLPVLREVGGEAVLYCPPGDVEAWARQILGRIFPAEPFPSPQLRLAQAARFTWGRHADIIAGAYLRLAQHRNIERRA
jgi:glycosyltransferase involved in cell wall biosynthesis